MPATRARELRGSGAPRGGAPRPASRPGQLRAGAGDDLVGGFRVSARSDDWFRDPAPRSSGRAGSGYPGASEPTDSVFGGGNPGSVRESGGQQAGASGYRNPSAWPEQPPAHAGGGSGRTPQYQPGRTAGSGGGYSGGGSSGRGRRGLRPRRIPALIAPVAGGGLV